MDKELNTVNRNVFDKLIRDEIIFKNRESLSTSYVPSEFPHRFDEINEVANILKTAFYGSRPSNILIYGQTGTGKTAISKFICKQLKDKARNENVKIHTAYINCKQTNTPYGVLTNIGKTYSAEWDKQIPNAGWRIDKVYSSLKEKADENGGIAIVILDEIDTLVSKNGDEILYHLTGLNSDLDNSKISIIGISNDAKFTSWLDPRVKSRLGEESLTFSPYNAPQIEDILLQRAKLAFKENTVDPLVMTYCASRAAQEHGDARKAIDLLRIAAELAEREERKIVTLEHVNKAQNVMERDQVRSIVITLPIQHKATLASIILNQGNRIQNQQTTGEVYSTYTKLCNSYKIDKLTQRRIGHIIAELDMQGLINAKVVNLGRHGRTKYIDLAVDKNQLLNIIKNDHFLSDLIDSMNKKQIFAKSLQSKLV